MCERVPRRAHEAGVDDVLAADALLIGCSENFGGMAGMVKDFLERVYYPCEHKLEGRAWSHFICCGNDGSGALRGLERVATGLRLRRVHPGRAVAGRAHRRGPGRARGDARAMQRARRDAGGRAGGGPLVTSG